MWSSVHGGGPQASEISRKLGIEPVMIAGRRVTDARTLSVVKMVYAGQLNLDLTVALQKQHCKAVGLSGVDGDMIQACKRPPVSVETDDGDMQTVDFGFVGDIVSVNTETLSLLLDQGYVPVLSCLSSDGAGQALNINADSIAEAVAVSMQAKKLVFITQSGGLFANLDDPGSLIPFADKQDLDELLQSGAVSAGMRPKLDACLKAVQSGVKRTHIIGGFSPDALLVELFTGEGCGTMIVEEREKQVYQETELA